MHRVSTPLRIRESADADTGAARKVSVLHVVLNIHEGGLERMLGDLLRGIDRERFESHVIALEFLGRLSAGLDEFATLDICERMTKGSLFWPRALIRRIRHVRPDIVHMHTGVWYKASLAARRAGVPSLIYTEHGRTVEDPLRDQLMDRRAARRTDVVVPVSDLLAEQLGRRIVRESSKLRTIHNGVDTVAFQPRTQGGRLRAELGIASDVPIIGSIGRLARVKGFDIMIDAFARLRSSWTGSPHPMLVIAGGGPEMDALKRRAAASGAADRIRLLGWRDDVHDLHAAFTLYSMSSRSEGTSIGLLEAMASGLCPVVTRVGGNPFVLGSDLVHRLCAPEDPEALARAWADALESDRRVQEGAVARARVVSDFSAARMIRDYQELYSELCYRGAAQGTSHGAIES